MVRKVEKIATPASEDQLVSALRSAWSKSFGGQPTLKQLAMLYSQIAVETGHGKHIYNNNVGNINWTKNFSGNYYETGDSRTVGNNPANRQHYTAKMRSYSNLDDGVTDYVNLLKKRTSVAKSLQEGTVKDFSYSLAATHYYDPHIRDDYVNAAGKKISGYTTGLTSIYNGFLKRHRSGSNVEKSKSSDSVITNLFSKLTGLLDNLSKAASQHTHLNKAKENTSKFLISISSKNDFATKLEYARILKIALKEEINSISEIYSDGNDVEIECIVEANETTATDVLKELCFAISSTFEFATKKIGSNKIYTFVSPNESSCYQELDIKIAEINYRKFQLKFAGLNDKDQPST